MIEVALTTDTTVKPAAAWGAVLSMALCVAMLIASEFMPVTWASGRFLKGDVARLLRLPALLMGGCTLGLLFLGGSPFAAGVLLALWGANNTAMSVIWMTWMSQNADDAPEAAGSLMVAAVQASILLGAVAGGWLLDGFSIRATFIGSVVLAGAALVLIGNGRRLLKPR
ncbi:hypothetical protein [Brevundimonas sp. EYE_349]|uniref:hypothetical protein n=1 Tax=Brevundimonas sp. EYE_349 TaxID=2853455 RepID=UPI0020032A2D|nr:hypothetical protein [Brevundimonas sp. EYE_349]MCK6102929.1 hypothetical protein [Brevundimonas sp. EYE_349]